MTGETLLIALRRTEQCVMVLHGTRVQATITAEEATRLISESCGKDWRGHGTRRRVRAIEMFVPPKEAPIWQKCFRTACSAVLPPSIEWLRSRSGNG